MKYEISFPLASLLFVVFLVLKLCGFISWSWWWITAPLWIPLAFLILLFGMFATLLGLTVLNKIIK